MPEQDCIEYLQNIKIDQVSTATIDVWTSNHRSNYVLYLCTRLRMYMYVHIHTQKQNIYAMLIYIYIYRINNIIYFGMSEILYNILQNNVWK